MGRADRIREREGKRLEDKDALDVLRLLRAIPVETFTHRLHELGESPLAGVVTREAVDHLRALFGTTTAAGTLMAVRATERLEDPRAIAESCAALTDELLQALGK